MFGLGEQDEAGVGVHITEARADDHAGGVNGTGGFGVADGASEDADRFVLDANGAVVAGVSGTVNYQAVLDKQV